MKAHEIDHFYWPIVIQSIFDWTFNLNKDFAKGKRMAYQTRWNTDMIARHLGLWKESCVAVDILVGVVTDTMLS